MPAGPRPPNKPTPKHVESGFTQGTVGVGVDAFAMIGLKLDTGDGRNGGHSSFDVMPVDSDGQARDEYTKVGGAAKVRALIRW
jgi:hypothetical protein